MTHVAPVGAGDPDPLDLDAAAQLAHNETGRLELVRARAEKWIGGVSALSALLSTVLVLKGPDTATKITVGWRVVAALALGAALALLATGTYRSYQAAFGNPGSLDQVSPDPLTGLHQRLQEARRAASDAALVHLAAAVQCVFVAVALIAAAVAVSWFAPSQPTTPASTTKTVCVYVEGRLVVRLAGTTADIAETPAGTTIRACP